MIERRNIIKLLSDRSRSKVYHSAILTCYNFDSIFFESVYLPALRYLGVTNVIVLMDAGMYDDMLADASYVCHRVSPINYTLVRQENQHHGVFHPKITLLFGEEEGALIIGSGNLTFSGLSNNEEVWNAFHVVGNQSAHYPLLLKTWHYVKETLQTSSSLVQKQLVWIPEQSPWLQDCDYESVVTLASGEQCSIVYNHATSRIFAQLVESIGDSAVEEITVIAPFYDAAGGALTELKRQFNPIRMNCVLDLDRQSAPYALLESESDIAFFQHTASNPLHAKMIEIQSDKGTWLLTGSANAGSMALGLREAAYNDEACVLLHSLERRNYLAELGIQYESLSDEVRKSIVRPKSSLSQPSTVKTMLRSCEEIDGRLYLHFSRNGIKGSALILDKEQKIIHQEEIVSDDTVALSMDESLLPQSHIAVLMGDEAYLSNRCLIIRELNVETCNPDPKRRKLSNLLGDNSLLQNLNHILDYIEFDEDEKKAKAVGAAAASASKAKEDIVVAQDRFNELKDSSLSISTHSGVRILAYLQQVLFKKDEPAKSDDALLAIDKEENGAGNENENPDYDCQNSVAAEANKMRTDIVNYLKRMQQYLQNMTTDTSIHGEINKALNSPKLIAVPGLNASSSIVAASRSVIVLMNNYGSNVIKRKVVRELLVSCARLFFSLYANSVPEPDSKRSRKVRELLREASVDLFSALSFFGFDEKDTSLPLVVLNCLDLWKNDKEELESIILLYEEQLSKLNVEDIRQNTVGRIFAIAQTYLEGEVPIKEFGRYDEVIYQYRKGYGFLLVDNIKLSSGMLSYEYHGSWFDGKIISNATKYRGYKDL